jgi:hypothetical protein
MKCYAISCTHDLEGTEDHISECYFCFTDVSGHTSKNKRSIEYPYLPSALKPVPHSAELLVPERPESSNLEHDAEMDSNDRYMDVDDMDHYTEYVLPYSENPHFIKCG